MQQNVAGDVAGDFVGTYKHRFPRNRANEEQ